MEEERYPPLHPFPPCSPRLGRELRHGTWVTAMLTGMLRLDPAHQLHFKRRVMLLCHILWCTPAGFPCTCQGVQGRFEAAGLAGWRAAGGAVAGV